MKVQYYLLLIFFMYASCVTQKAILSPVIDRDLVTFSSNELPLELNNAIKDNRIIILGETHYVQEHQDFIFVLLKRLTSVKKPVVFIQEQPSAFNWMIDDYLNGQIDYLTNDIKYFDDFLFEKIKKLNSKSDESSKIKFLYMDVNHGKSFLTSIIESEKIIGKQIEFESLKRAVFDSDDYLKKLRELKTYLQLNKNELIKKWGKKWYFRYSEMIETEIASSIYRTKNDEKLREKVMFNFVYNKSNENAQSKIIINCGMFHAQKNTQMGRNYKRIGGLLNQVFPNEVYAIAFVGIKGYTKKGHWYNETVKYNLLNESKKNDLIKVIAKKSSDLMSFIPLSDSVFRNRILISYYLGKANKVKPLYQFDAIITYPSISVLNSMNNYKFKGY